MQQLRYHSHDFWVINDVHVFFIDKSAVKETGQKNWPVSSAHVFCWIPSVVVTLFISVKNGLVHHKGHKHDEVMKK